MNDSLKSYKYIVTFHNKNKKKKRKKNKNESVTGNFIWMRKIWFLITYVSS